MIGYNNRGTQKVNSVLKIRAKYEVSPHFEVGYIVSEILERYRKMVGLIQHLYEFPSDVVFDVIKTTELVQKLFLEIYHLVNTVNEIPRKYSHMEEFHVQNPSVSRDELKNSQKNFERLQRERQRQRKKKQKEMKKQRELFLKGQGNRVPQKPKKPPNKWWPIDYGWEIDYQWW
ncbi:unnamed protein product, partial [Brenthis ino]